MMETGELASVDVGALESSSTTHDFLKKWAEDVATDLEHGLQEFPGWNVFKLVDGTTYRTYWRTAPDRFLVEPYHHQLLDEVPDGRDAEFPLRRHDEY